MSNSDVILKGRHNSQLELQLNDTIVLKTSSNSDASTLKLDSDNRIASLAAAEIVLTSLENTNSEYSIIYGERLLELLRWIIQILKTHSHPPNGQPIPDFFPESDKWLQQMDKYLLNTKVRTR